MRPSQVQAQTWLAGKCLPASSHGTRDAFLLMDRANVRDQTRLVRKRLVAPVAREIRTVQPYVVVRRENMGIQASAARIRLLALLVRTLETLAVMFPAYVIVET